MIQVNVRTSVRSEFVEITRLVQAELDRAGPSDGFCTVYVPHTTAGVTINEHADPDVVRDMVMALDKLVPWDDPDYRHAEGNSAAHVKASLMGNSVRVAIAEGRLTLGRWQGIFFCEFDGPRRRSVHVYFDEREG